MPRAGVLESINCAPRSDTQRGKESVIMSQRAFLRAIQLQEVTKNRERPLGSILNLGNVEFGRRFRPVAGHSGRRTLVVPR